ncbi:alpha-2,8-polysialyltransferase family protein [Streptacidiphilus sp. ASG 303]|uniref:alpha-2,8-polysialyltransferase family protein n=1 Tax=Streptacidiphilus sp. ASG 303 TaxID=2896847 RepID=UPI001E3AB755|nr:alpha-2,8-polysialyltransferase family protein [Streptacidiphilus sp. ASG 303]
MTAPATPGPREETPAAVSRPAAAPVPAAAPAGTVQIFAASTLYGAATVCAALDAGLFGPRADHRRILLVCNNAAIPENAVPLDRTASFAALRDRFDEVRSWNEEIEPYHPSGWTPRPEDVPILQRLMRRTWGLGDAPVEIAVESIQVSPARAITAVFDEGPVHVYADGLMSYGPTRNPLPYLLHGRIRRLLHLDLVPGLRPLLLSEYGVEPQAVPTGAFLDVLASVGRAAPPTPAAPAGEDGPAAGDGSAPGPALLLGQYLSALGLITPAEEEELHARMLRGAVAAGLTDIVFKPHPSAPSRLSRELEKAAADAGATLRILDDPVLAETLYERLRPSLVVGCFSTALLTAASLYGIPAARVGTALLLERLAPYENSNRIPVTVVDALLPDLEAPGFTAALPDPGPEGAAGRLGPLVTAVGYCMQGKAYPHLAAEAADWLHAHYGPDTARYFKRRRLTALGLPGGLPGGFAGGVPAGARLLGRSPLVRRVVRQARARRSSPGVS